MKDIPIALLVVILTCCCLFVQADCINEMAVSNGVGGNDSVYSLYSDMCGYVTYNAESNISEIRRVDPKTGENTCVQLKGKIADLSCSSVGTCVVSVKQDSNPLVLFPTTSLHSITTGSEKPECIVPEEKGIWYKNIEISPDGKYIAAVKVDSEKGIPDIGKSFVVLAVDSGIPAEYELENQEFFDAFSWSEENWIAVYKYDLLPGEEDLVYKRSLFRIDAALEDRYELKTPPVRKNEMLWIDSGNLISTAQDENGKVSVVSENVQTNETVRLWVSSLENEAVQQMVFAYGKLFLLTFDETGDCSRLYIVDKQIGSNIYEVRLPEGSYGMCSDAIYSISNGSFSWFSLGDAKTNSVPLE